MEPLEKYDAVVISGGGNKGILSLGALHYSYEKGTYDPDHVRIYAGTSIGAVIGLLMICGYKPMEAFAEIYTMAYFFNIGDCHSIWDVAKFMGLMSIRGFAEKIEELVKAKLGDVPTLKELRKRTGKTLVVSVANITKMKCEYYTHKTRPNLGCVDAVKLSSNLPLVFQRIRYEDCYVTDGGLMDNFPLQYIDDRSMKVLGIVTLGTDFTLPDNQFMGYFYRLIVMPIAANTELRCDLAGKNTTIVKIDSSTAHASAIAFAMPSEQKMSMFLQGYAAAEKVDQTVYLKIPEWKDTIHDLTDSDTESDDTEACDEASPSPPPSSPVAQRLTLNTSGVSMIAAAAVSTTGVSPGGSWDVDWGLDFDSDEALITSDD